jgi:hypothetical protein
MITSGIHTSTTPKILKAGIKHGKKILRYPNRSKHAFHFIVATSDLWAFVAGSDSVAELVEKHKHKIRRWRVVETSTAHIVEEG